MTNSDPQTSAPNHSSRVKRWVSAGLTFLVGGGAWAAATKWDDAEPMQRRICVEWAMTRDLAQRSGQCMPKLQTIPTAEAEKTLNAFIGTTMGDPAKTFPMLASTYQANPAHDEFIKEWNDVAWMERLAEDQPTQTPNEFLVRLRLYRVKPLQNPALGFNYWAAREVVDVRTYLIRLERQPSSDILVTRVAPQQKFAGKSRAFALAVFTVNTYGRQKPNPSSDPTNASDVRKGSSLRVLCATPDSRWYSTYIGWFPSDEVGLEQIPVDDPILICGRA